VNDSTEAATIASNSLRSFFASHPALEKRYHNDPVFHRDTELLRHMLAATVDAHTAAGLDPGLSTEVIVAVIDHMMQGHDRPSIPPMPMHPPRYGPVTVVRALADKAKP
jgi:hypothetical protein